VTRNVSVVVDAATVRRRRIARLWTQYSAVFIQISELVSTQLMHARFDELGYADRQAVLGRTEFLIEAWARAGSHHRRTKDGSTLIKDALDRVCRLGDEIALIESPAGAVLQRQQRIDRIRIRTNSSSHGTVASDNRVIAFPGRR
jgi:hypothetical protein